MHESYINNSFKILRMIHDDEEKIKNKLKCMAKKAFCQYFDPPKISPTISELNSGSPVVHTLIMF